MSILDCTIVWIAFPIVELILKPYSVRYGLTVRELLPHTLMIPDLYPAQALVEDDQDQSEGSIEVPDHSQPIRGQY